MSIKISLEGDTGKVEDFRKMKKPVEIQIVEKEKQDKISPQEVMKEENMEDQAGDKNQIEENASGAVEG